jgi:hypothetical protein
VACAWTFAAVALDGWSVIEKLDGYDPTRNIEEAYWHFFSLARGSSSFAIGPNIESTPSNAINRVLTKRAK